MSDETWSRHSNPISGWSRFVAFFFFVWAVWMHSIFGVLALGVFFLVNPKLWRPPKDDSSWMTKAVLGEKIWMRDESKAEKRMLLGVFGFAVFALLLYCAYLNLFLPTITLTAGIVVWKLLFLDELVKLYEKEKAKKNIIWTFFGKIWKILKKVWGVIFRKKD